MLEQGMHEGCERLTGCPGTVLRPDPLANVLRLFLHDAISRYEESARHAGEKAWAHWRS